MLKIKQFIFIIISLFFTTYIFSENWYGYYYGNTQIGYAKSNYYYDKSSKIYHHKKTKTLIIQKQKQSEEISGVLNQDYTVRSLYITTKEKKSSKFIIINVGKEITVQTVEKVYTFPFKKFYLHMEDFLKSLLSKPLHTGKYYRSVVLSSNKLSLVHATAHYLGKKRYNNQESYEFKITNDELKKQWAYAYISPKKKLIGYQINNLLVVQVSQKNALSFLQAKLIIAAPYIQDINKLQKVYIATPNHFLQSSYQKQEKEYIVLQSTHPETFVSFKQITKQQSMYLQNSKNYPVANSYIQQYAQLSRYSAQNPIVIARNVARWIHFQMNAKKSKYRILLQQLWDMKKETEVLALITLCRANGIPARMLQGWILHQGFFRYENWCEVYLGKWTPLYQGKIDTGARFLSTPQKQNITLQIKIITKNNKNIHLNRTSNYLKSNGKIFKDELLGIEAIRPNDWIFLPKNPYSNLLVMRSLKGTGPAIFIKVIKSSKTLEDILQNMPRDMLKQNVKILWAQKRKFQNISGLEGALKSDKFIYRVFIGQRKSKVVFALLFVPKSEFKIIEKEFFAFVSSLKFT